MTDTVKKFGTYYSINNYICDSIVFFILYLERALSFSFERMLLCFVSSWFSCCFTSTCFPNSMFSCFKADNSFFNCSCSAKHSFNVACIFLFTSSNVFSFFCNLPMSTLGFFCSSTKLPTTYIVSSSEYHLALTDSIS